MLDLKQASDITTDVILFDIDAKSESDTKADKDSIVKVLNKVFNEMQGFCGSIPWIADIERKMTQDGLYEQFKDHFKELSGSRWEESREDFYYEEDAIIEALCKTTGMSEESARHWFELAEQDYTISIEKFAKRVKEYIEEKHLSEGERSVFPSSVEEKTLTPEYDYIFGFFPNAESRREKKSPPLKIIFY